MAVASNMVFEQTHKRQVSLQRLEAIAKVMDGIFVLPGTNIRVGLDPLLGLMPVIGDLAASLVSAYLIWEAHKLGAPKTLLARMVGNMVIDTVTGSIPVFGDAFDVLFRSNMKNMALLRRYVEDERIRCRFGPIIEGDFTRTG